MRSHRALGAPPPQVPCITDRLVPLSLRVDLGGAGEQLVPADYTLAQVDLVQPHVGLADQGFLDELAAVGDQEQLARQHRNTDVTLSDLLAGWHLKQRLKSPLNQ